MAGKFKMRGGDKLMRLLKNASKEASDTVRTVIRSEASKLVKAAQAAAPKDTGALRQAIRARYLKKGLLAQVGIFGLQRKNLLRASAAFRASVTYRKGVKVGKRFAGRVSSQLIRAPFYAPHVEFGTKKMAKRPFLYPTYRGNRTKIRSEIVKASVRAIRKSAR